MNFFHELAECVEKSGVPCYECEVAETTDRCGSPVVDVTFLVSELRKLAEQEDKNWKSEVGAIASRTTGEVRTFGAEQEGKNPVRPCQCDYEPCRCREREIVRKFLERVEHWSHKPFEEVAAEIVAALHE